MTQKRRATPRQLVREFTTCRLSMLGLSRKYRGRTWQDVQEVIRKALFPKLEAAK